MKKQKSTVVSNPSWDRIGFIIGELGITVSAFSRSCGLSHPAALYQIKAGRYKMSGRLARMIVETYPKYSLGWLMTGEGNPYSMLEDALPVASSGTFGPKHFEIRLYVTSDQIAELKKWIATLEKRHSAFKTSCPKPAKGKRGRPKSLLPGKDIKGLAGRWDVDVIKGSSCGLN